MTGVVMREGPAEGWKRVDAKMRVVRLSLGLQLLIPALIFPSLSTSTRGLTLHPGRMGLLLGILLLASSALVGFLLWTPAGLIGVILSAWALGTVGGATLACSVRPTAFVKPICVRCRLLPVIREHEAIHLTGVSSEDDVWAQMRTRHSQRSLSLKGDPAICAFCPIPKRLAER